MIRLGFAIIAWYYDIAYAREHIRVDCVSPLACDMVICLKSYDKKYYSLTSV